MKKARSRSTPGTKKRASSEASAREPKAPHVAPPDRSGRLVISRQVLAELLGVHPDTVTDYARGGMPVMTMGGRGKESEYDAVACLEWWRSKQGKNAKENAQTRAFIASAELNELKLATQRGDLVSSAEVIASGQAFTKAWTTMIRALPRQAVQAGIIEREREPQLLGLIRPVLQEIAGWKTLAEVQAIAVEPAQTA